MSMLLKANDCQTGYTGGCVLFTFMPRMHIGQKPSAFRTTLTFNWLIPTLSIKTNATELTWKHVSWFSKEHASDSEGVFKYLPGDFTPVSFI